MKANILLLLFVFLLLSCEEDDLTPSIQDVLQSEKDIEFSEELNEYDQKVIKFSIRQPIDHDNPSGPYFIQKGTLLHRNYNLPVIFMPNGYGRDYIRPYDLTQYSFNSAHHSGQPNVIAVNHRYYGNEGEDFEKFDPKFLNIEQATRDLHRIVEIFKEVYKSQWIGMGYSKGGRTCIYHKYFFPDDIDVTLSFVAPITLREHDERFIDFVKGISNPEEYDRMIKFQRLLLQKRNELIPFFEDWYESAGLEMDRETDKVIEGMALGYPFSYWQYRSYWRFSSVTILDAPLETDNVEEIFLFYPRQNF